MTQQKTTNILTNRKTFIRKSLDELVAEGIDIVFYDIETDDRFAPYAKLKSIAVQYGLDGKVEMVDRRERRERFRKALVSPNTLKVAFNNINFDDIVLHRHGFPIHPQNRHDVFFMFKNISPNLPAFSLKFTSFYFLGDPHFPEMDLAAWCADHNMPMFGPNSKPPESLFRAYNKHDVIQTVNLFRVAWDVVTRRAHWETYLNDLMIGEPLLEMTTEGGILLDRPNVWRRLQRLQKTVQHETQRALEITRGEVQNPNSSKQLARYFTEFDNIELALTNSGEFSVKKSVLVSLRDTNPLADCAFKIREANGTIKYFENYLNALEDETYVNLRGPNWIPVQFSANSARTLRFTSQSLYRLNFQNENEDAKAVQLVPPGFLGFWFDATQIENVVHIYESGDTARRKAYESDYNWNEYVWLCNQIYHKDEGKDYWDNKKTNLSPRIPSWTIYKETKTGKLAINFGMGVTKFCSTFGLDRDVGEEVFRYIHSACPAIRGLQQRVGSDLSRVGFVQDVFEKRYSGSLSKAYKVVAYLIQGCGTGSLPKAQIRANWEALRHADLSMPERLRRLGHKAGVMCKTIHDENSGRIDLRLGTDSIIRLLQRMNLNMTERFTPLFDDIPLRSKMYLSKSNAKDRIEVDIKDTNRITKIINGSACPVCRSTGTNIKGQTCNACKGVGYVSA